jgi:hypothetical protein
MQQKTTRLRITFITRCLLLNLAVTFSCRGSLPLQHQTLQHLRHAPEGGAGKQGDFGANETALGSI